MKKKNIIITLFIMFFIITGRVEALSGTIINTDSGTDDIPIRYTVGGDFKKYLAYGSTVEVLNTNAGNSYNYGCNGGTWYHVRQGIEDGFMCGDFVKLESDKETGKVLCIEDNSPLNIWSDVYKTSKIKSLACDTGLTILAKDVATNNKCATTWYKVEYDGAVGYACGKYIGSNSSSPNIGKSTTGDNIYQKDNYQSKGNYDGTISCYEDTTDSSLRRTIGGAVVENISCGVPVKINSVQNSTGSCKYYYNVTNMETNTSGWICGYYVSTTKLSSFALDYYNTKENLEEYYNKLKNDGFPDSYLPYLAEIHARHPNWKFNARLINLTFDEVVAGESFNGRSLLDGRNNSFDKNYFSMGLDTYNILSDTFYDYATESGWYNASSEAIAFYLDPRNYLNEKYIFAFEPLLYNSGYTAGQINDILNQGFWNAVYGEGSKVGEDIINASKEADISAMHIASRIRQEINGISESDPRLGGEFSYNDTIYSGYYNFYNIAVYGQNKIVNGMVYAMNNGWDTPYKGLLGGAKFIREGYIGVGQDTVYYEKFDVRNNDVASMYSHQYQQNLSVAFNETNTSFNRYVTYDNYLERENTFIIPVYKEMPNYTVTSPRIGNPNNYLKDLQIDGNTVNGFAYDNYSYDITLPAGTSSIEVKATKINNNASISGVGKITIDSDDKKIDIIVTAENKRTRTYTLNITRLKASEEDIIDISTIMNNSGVKYNDNYMFGIRENTDSSSFVANVKKISNLNSVSIKDKDGNAKTGNFKTGDLVTISNSKDTKKYTVVIYGDINGNGVIDKDDCLEILRNLKGYANLKGSFKEAADTDHNGIIDKDDCLEILRHLKGYTNLNG